MGDLNLKTECPEEKKKMEDAFPLHNTFIYAPTFHRASVWSSLDHILVLKTYMRKFKCISYKNIYSDHSSVNIRYKSN
jgi:endonuclease/exonuclease/phosphatase family metal-dependent hydrolase